jgi:hypothetical protein
MLDEILQCYRTYKRSICERSPSTAPLQTVGMRRTAVNVSPWCWRYNNFVMTCTDMRDELPVCGACAPDADAGKALPMKLQRKSVLVSHKEACFLSQPQQWQICASHGSYKNNSCPHYLAEILLAEQAQGLKLDNSPRTRASNGPVGTSGGQGWAG